MVRTETCQIEKEEEYPTKITADVAVFSPAPQKAAKHRILSSTAPCHLLENAAKTGVFGLKKGFYAPFLVKNVLYA